MQKTASNFWTVAAIFSISFVVLMACQYTTTIIDYEARFVTFTQYALIHGLTYFPVYFGKLYPDYPIGNTVLLYLTALPFGKLSIFTIGIPYCLTAAATITLTYKIAALHDKKWGLYAVLFSFFSWQYLYDVHNVAVDIYVVLATVACFYLVYSAKLKATRWRLCWIPLVLLFGLFTRGPIGIVVPASVVGSFYLLNKDWWAFIIFEVIAGVILVLGFGLLLWGAYLQGGQEFMRQVFAVESIGRIASHHASRYYYYVTAGWLPYLFTIIFALIVVIKRFKAIVKPKSETTKLLLYCCAWWALVIIGFTIPNTKAMRYVTPIAPALALLAAYIFIEPDRFKGTRKLLFKLCFFMPIIGLVIMVGALLHNHFATLQLQGYFLPATIILIAIFGINLWLRPKNEMLALGLGVVAFLVIAVFLLYPMVLHYKMLKEPADQIILLPYWPF